MTVGALLLYMFVTNVRPENFKNHILAYSLGMLGSSVIGTFRTSLPQLSEYFETVHTIYNGSQLAYRFTGLNYDPNYYAVSAVFAIILCFVLVINKQVNRLWGMALFSALLVFGFQSFSKTFLLAAVVTGVIFAVYMLTTVRMLVVLALSGTAVGGVALWLENKGYMDMMLGRLSAGDISTGRFEIWRTYLGHMEGSWRTLLLGDGLQAGYLPVGGPHNTYIESVYFVGIVGSLLFLGMLILLFSARVYNRQRCIINYLAVLIFMVMIGVLSCFTINEFFFYCMLMWMGLNIPISGRKKPKGGETSVQHNSPGI
jgi:O-antigen ligase